MSDMPMLFDEDALDAARARRLKVLGGVGALAAMAAVAAGAFVFTGGDEPLAADTLVPAAATDTFDPVADPATTSTTVAGGAAEEVADADVPRTTEIFSSKNPFTPLVDMTPDAAPAEAAPTETTPSTVLPTEPVTVAPVADTPASSATVQHMTLDEVFNDADGKPRAKVTVDMMQAEVGVGDTFAGNFEVKELDVAEGWGEFLYGDKAFKIRAGINSFNR